jgi:hypothetical protein
MPREDQQRVWVGALVGGVAGAASAFFAAPWIVSLFTEAPLWVLPAVAALLVGIGVVAGLLGPRVRR